VSRVAEQRQAIGEILVERGLITAGQLEGALEVQRATGGRLGEVLVEHGLIDRMAIASALATQWYTQPPASAEAGTPASALEAHVEPPAPADAERQHVAALLATIAELEQTVAKLKETLARRDEQLVLLTEIITGQAEINEPTVEAAKPQPPPTTSPAAWVGVIPRAGEHWTGAPPRLGDLLVSKGFITDEQLAEALVESRETNERLGRVLLRRGWVFESELARTLSEQWSIPYVDLSQIGVDRGIVRLLPRDIGLEFAAIPVRQLDGAVQVAFADPSDREGLDAVRAHVPSAVPAVAELTDIETAWRAVASGR
jgi:uncharacterized coiled-coil protein SlyX